MDSRVAEVTPAESLLVSFASFPAAVILIAFFWDLLGFVLAPLPILAVSVACAVAALVSLWPRAEGTHDETIVAAVIVVSLLAWLLWIAWPSLLPPGGGPDLTHHLILIDYIERHWRLVHDVAAEPFLGEMVAYTPGSHLLAALAGAWTGRDGLHTIYPIIAVTVALKGGFVFTIALRMLARDAHRVPLAATAVLLLLLPQAYFVGSFTHDSFLAQVVSELFAIVMWWAVAAWDHRPAALWMVIFAVAGAAAFLTWPVWVGAPMATLMAVVIVRRDLSLRQRAAHVLLGAGPVLAAGGVYMAGRMAWAGIVRSSGAVLPPSLEVYGWSFALLSTFGFLLALIDRRRRTLVLLAVALAGQMMALFITARQSGATTPYMALKMAYLGIYPQAVAGAVALAAAWNAARLLIATRRTTEVGLAVGRREAWVITLLLACAVLPGGLAPPLRARVVTADLTRAGRWARANVPRDCVDYLVASGDTAYWLHLAALGNPRASERTAALDTFDGRAALGPWVAGESGPTYAIADLTRLPNEVRNRADVLATFGSAAVLKRRGPSACPAS